MKFHLFKTILFCFLSINLDANSVKDLLKDKFIVVLDAGHGGHDGGATGSEVNEKNITLQIAIKLKDMLESKYSNIQVVLTRDSDRFIPLYERINIANNLNADLFISIHCNWINSPKTRGTETFVMGLHRADENLKVAQRENEVILLENDYENNYEGYDPNSPVGHIILSSYQDAYLNKSLQFAEKVEKNLGKNKISVSRGVKQAGFAVLRRATMPSVLVETGFLGNKDEEAWLSSENGQHQICNSIASSVGDFFNIDKQQEHTSSIPHSESETKITKTYDKAQNPLAKIITRENTETIGASTTYRVQIAASKNPSSTINNRDFTSIGDLHTVEMNGVYKYQIGDYTSEKEAKEAKKELAAKGYKQAFIVKI